MVGRASACVTGEVGERRMEGPRLKGEVGFVVVVVGWEEGGFLGEDGLLVAFLDAEEEEVVVVVVALTTLRRRVGRGGMVDVVCEGVRVGAGASRE